ncbi:Family with sequence similarity 8, member A1 [Cichlidogyrus casuarinus]|uniref:Family with sequence similarity 8, member A1 n=1 Tax=Cichlidogyrus casuarinus TaxID=1844966 RepID=A0ABD2QPE4_9PLAT
MNKSWKLFHDQLKLWVDRYPSRIVKTQDQIEYEEYLSTYYAQKKYSEEMETFSHATRSPGTQNRQNPQDSMAMRNNRFAVAHPIARLAAEFIDFILMLIFKIFLVFILHCIPMLSNLIESMSFDIVTQLIARNFSNLAFLATTLVNGDSEMNIDHLFLRILKSFSLELRDLNYFIFVELLSRFIRSLVEWVLISKNFFDDTPGGSTPGKWFLNLKVVSCDLIVSRGANVVEVYPGTNPGFFRSFVRSQIKELSYFTIFYFICILTCQHNRSPYDLFAGTVVVRSLPTVDPDPSLNNPQHHGDTD